MSDARGGASTRPERAAERLLLIGPMPPPLTGQSVAFRLLVDVFADNPNVAVVDLADRAPRRDAEFTLQRAFSMLRIALEMWSRARGARLVYLQVAQSRWGFLRDLLVIALARWRGCRVVGHLHGGGYASFYDAQPWLLRAVIRRTLRGVDRMIVLSESLRSSFAFMGDGYDARLAVLPNACPIALGAARRAPRGRLHLVYLSNLLVEKGYLDCIDAVCHLRRLLPDVEFRLSLAGSFLLGNDEYRSVESLEDASVKQVRHMESTDEVSFVGVINDREKIALLDDADLFVLPTYYGNEGQPISVIEGIARGLPCIVTDWRGIADIVGGEDVAAFVPPRSPLAIAEAAAGFYRDPERYEACSARAIERAVQFSQDAHVAGLIGILNEFGVGLEERCRERKA